MITTHLVFFKFFDGAGEGVAVAFLKQGSILGMRRSRGGR